MRRSLTTRVFAALFGIWFAAALTEPAALHACPMHGGAHGSAHGSAHGGAHGAGHVQSHAGAEMHHGDAGAPVEQHASTCTCLGACCGAVATAVPPDAAPHALTVLVRPAAAASVPVSAAYRPSEPEHARPPSQGPPTALA